MLNVESRSVRSIQHDIRKSKTIVEANKHAFYALGMLDTKWEDGKITEETRWFLSGQIEKELEIAECRLKNKNIDQALELFRPREEEKRGERSRKSIVPVTRYRKKSIS